MIKLTDIYGDEWEINPSKIVGFRYSNERTRVVSKKEPETFFLLNEVTAVFINNKTIAYFKGDKRKELKA